MSDDSAILPIVAVVVLGALTVLYSVLVLRAPLAWVSAVVPIVVLYLAWRFVRAHERVAAALEPGD